MLLTASPERVSGEGQVAPRTIGETNESLRTAVRVQPVLSRQVDTAEGPGIEWPEAFENGPPAYLGQRAPRNLSAAARLASRALDPARSSAGRIPSGRRRAIFPRGETTKNAQKRTGARPKARPSVQTRQYTSVGTAPSGRRGPAAGADRRTRAAARSQRRAALRRSVRIERDADLRPIEDRLAPRLYEATRPNSSLRGHHHRSAERGGPVPRPPKDGHAALVRRRPDA